MIVSAPITLLLALFSPAELLGPHPAPLAVAVAVAMTVGATLMDSVDIVETVLKARRENIPLWKFRSTIMWKVIFILSLWILFGPAFTPLPRLVHLVPLIP